MYLGQLVFILLTPRPWKTCYGHTRQHHTAFVLACQVILWTLQFGSPRVSLSQVKGGADGENNSLMAFGSQKSKSIEVKTESQGLAIN